MQLKQKIQAVIRIRKDGKMQEIKCPKCGTVFQVEESGYAEIVKQVRDKEFEKAIADRVREMEKARGTELELS